MSLISVSLYALVSTSDSSEVIVDTLITNGSSVSKTPTGINFVTGISPHFTGSTLKLSFLIPAPAVANSVTGRST